MSIIDTSIRDGQMSLWATAMTTASILPLARSYNEANYSSIEIIGLALFKKLIRELKDNPFERIRRFRELAPDTTLRVVHSRHALGFQVTPPDVYRLLTEQLRANGIDEVRMSDPSNTISTHVRNKSIAESSGLRVITNIVFAPPPKHTDEYFRRKAADIAQLVKPSEICLLDPGGMLTQDRLRTLVPALQAEIGDIPLSLLEHCNTGLGPVNALEAVELGIRKIDTAVPPLANGASLPSVISLARNLRARGYELDIDDDAIQRISEGLEGFRAARGLPAGMPAEFDEDYYRHQVPGGMISNLVFQLGKVGMGDRIDEVLEEVSRVREDLGYPIMVTPYAQFVGTQAALNVMTGERYQQVADEVLQYAIGLWGEDEANDIQPDALDRFLGNPRAKDIAAATSMEFVANQTVCEIRKNIGAESVSDEEFLLRYFTTEADVEELKKTKAVSRNAVENPWVSLIERAASVPNLQQLSAKKGGSSLLMRPA